MDFLNKIKTLLKFTNDSKKYIIIYTILSLIGSFLGIILPIFASLQLVNLTSGIWNTVIMCTILVLIITILNGIIDLLISICTEKFSKVIIRKIQINIAREILKIKTENIDKKSNGLFIQRLTNDASAISNIFTFGISTINSIVVEISVFIIVYFINFWIGLYFTGALLVLYSFSKLRVKYLNELDKKYREQREKTSGFATELIRGLRDIKMLNSENNFMSMVNENIEGLNSSNYKLNITRSTFWFLIQIIYALYNFILVILIIYFIKQNYLTLSLGVVIYSYKGYINDLVYRINTIVDYLREFNLSFDRVIEIFNGKEFTKEQYGQIHLDKVKGDFAFNNVDFSYGKNKVLDNISFKVNANETVAFVGKSGAGKSTIFNLLCKMYDVKKGTITIDGININKLDKDSIRGNITIINQNPYIFNMSIKDNLKLVKEDLTEEEMIKACKLACLDDFIETLEDKYDTIVGEGGVLLSGGQRQRLAIARALIQKTEIILFDEATSALDNETQNKIQKAIENMKNEYTVLIIAHRLSTIINADRILYLENGKIKAEGTHKQLLKTCKNYKELYESEIIKED